MKEEKNIKALKAKLYSIKFKSNNETQSKG